MDEVHATKKRELVEKIRVGTWATIPADFAEYCEAFGSYDPESLSTAARSNTQLIEFLVDRVRQNGQRDSGGILAFWAVFNIGPEALPFIRRAWDAEETKEHLAHLHLLLMDMLAAGGRDRIRMELVVGHEIDHWVRLLAEKSYVRDWTIWLFTGLWQFAPNHLATIEKAISGELDFLDSERTRELAERSLAEIRERLKTTP